MRNEGGTGRTCPELNVNHGRRGMRMRGLSAPEPAAPCPARSLMSLSMELKHGECCKGRT